MVNMKIVICVIAFCSSALFVNGQTLIDLVLPGRTDHGHLTKHCFPKAGVSQSDLGTYRQTDTCCREHNKCPKLGADQLYDCACEETFRQCLKANKNSVGESIFRNKLGKSYFNIVNTECSRQAASATCTRRITNSYDRSGATRCDQYEVTPGSGFVTLENKFYEN